MLFNSISYILFFPIVVVLYYITPHRFRWLLLLCASIVFYMFFIPWYIVIMIGTIGVSYFAGIYLERSAASKKRTILLAGVATNISVLVLFKYYNFITVNFSALTSLLGWNYSVATFKWLLPLGISFHTFQALSYLIEIYRGKQKAERNVGIFALYIMFFPQLVAGPIERPGHMLPQFYEKHGFDEKGITGGLKTIVLGFFKKVVIADHMALFVNQVYGQPTTYVGLPLIVATIAFAIQIYCDFSGYTDIAIGSAKVLGFRLTNNFNYPYLSRSIIDFWRRWHITLSYWFRDYVYIPLGGSRVLPLRHFTNLLLTFLFSGLWHGASWTFVVWGGLHGVYIVFWRIGEDIASKLFRRKYSFIIQRVLDGISTTLTFALVCFAWIFFRAPSLREAAYVATHLFTGFDSMIGSFLQLNFLRVYMQLVQQMQGVEFFFSDLLIDLVAVYTLVFIELLERQKPKVYYLPWFNWTLYVGLTLAILNFSVIKEIPFIYFQF